ncbi:ABC transporter substrate-binding protein [Telmatospirillum siberiense]|uniref:Extracellular solute-binding protein n=1 Tax=Telmatospirillum siberiense TaxID=382514 RepID=A0A2N3PQ26_9PROT|nr:ABC transporter substrate-binding protein [Telmatospirillum siberiense]PKU22506.1 hypothetical protein CWS72_21520 [Telmatospirillum siberiense]
MIIYSASSARALFAAAAILSALFASLSVQARDDVWEKLEARAKSEGAVAVYSTSSGGGGQFLFDEFERQYGIRVDHVGGRGNEFPERIRTEQISGRFHGDVTINGAGSIATHQRDGNLEPHGPLPNLSLVRPEIPVDENAVPVRFAQWGLLINTRRVAPGAEPTSWLDLLDSKWRKRIGLDDPRVPSSGSARFGAMIENYGRDYEERLRGLEPIVTMDLGGLRRRLLLGEISIIIDNPRFYVDELKKGGRLPIKYIVPREGALNARFDAAVLRNPPHPNAARLFLNFLLSPTAQRLIEADGNAPVTKVDSPDMPPEVRQLLEAPRLLMAPDEKSAGNLKLAQEIYGKL